MTEEGMLRFQDEPDAALAEMHAAGQAMMRVARTYGRY